MRPPDSNCSLNRQSQLVQGNCVTYEIKDPVQAGSDSSVSYIVVPTIPGGGSDAGQTGGITGVVGDLWPPQIGGGGGIGGGAGQGGGGSGSGGRPPRPPRPTPPNGTGDGGQKPVDSRGEILS